MIKKADIVYNSYGQLLDVYLPDGKIKAIFLYIHGGGIEAGSKNDGNYFAALTSGIWKSTGFILWISLAMFTIPVSPQPISMF